jgi:alkylhydroperoxidase/carboxymuconolactone decarboxylase family protein YurZ
MTTTDIEQQLENLASPRERETLLRGLAVLKQIGGENFGGPISQLASFSEDLARFTIQYPYGDVLSRDGLDLRTRQILTAATLLAHGSAQSQLSFHLNGLLNAGGTRDDVVGLLFIPRVFSDSRRRSTPFRSSETFSPTGTKLKTLLRLRHQLLSRTSPLTVSLSSIGLRLSS